MSALKHLWFVYFKCEYFVYLWHGLFSFLFQMKTDLSLYSL